jgi:hypothetical protein
VGDGGGQAEQFIPELCWLYAMALDVQEVIGAFLEKRKSVWCGK